MSGVSSGMRLRRTDRLRRSQDFQRLQRQAERRSGRHLVALVGPGFVAGRTRLGLTVSRRVGGAVQRNRVKRVIRAWFREHRTEIPAGKDVVVIARRGAAERSGAELRRELGDLLT